MSYQSEAQLEKNMIEQLVDMGYEKVTLSNYDSLVKNFREQINIFNIKNLKDIPLSDAEFERLMLEIDGKSIFESAKKLRIKQELIRDDGSTVFLQLMNIREWCKNNFQVTNQTTVEGKYKNRYDVTLLINGLPVVQIELKRRGLDFKEAFNQIQRYRQHSYKGLYRYLQIFVVSNGVGSKYFANSDGEILFSNTFFWSDKENNRVSNLSDFTTGFLDRCHISKMIARYMVLNETEKVLMVMRPYQVFAVEALVKRALDTKNNGYIWHTTGSGKTLTSFKTSQILANEPGIKKVFFLVDRRDLDSQTEKEFNKFEPGSVDRTDNTYNLVEQIKQIDKPLIITTIQKMANAIKSPRYTKIMEQYKDEKVIFIIDECHRSQFGKMHKIIRNHFKNSQYFGFTGTPRFEENKSSDGRTTADIFEKCLHYYLIKDAIHDGNVLGFSVEYIKTLDVDFDENDSTKVEAIDTDEVWNSETRLKLICENIIDNHHRKSKSKGYNALFTVDSIPTLIKYYDIFKSMDHNLKIAGIFTYGANEDLEEKGEHSRDSLERMIDDYNKMFDTNYSTESYISYLADVDRKVRTAQIDILLVVKMFLTGFDSKRLNTLYVDKFLKHHDLLQAFSRTNRTEKSTKPYGNIVCFRNLKFRTDESIKMFSRTDNVDTVLMKPYEEYIDVFNSFVDELYKLSPTPGAIDEIKDEEEQKKFVIIFREMTKYLIKLQTFDKFEFSKENLGISEQEYQDYKSKYLMIYDTHRRVKDKESILDDVDFSIELMHTDRINVSYIMNLIRNINIENVEEKENDIKAIIGELDKADNEELRYKVDLIKAFLSKVVPGLTPEDSIDNSYSEFEQKEREKEIKEFANEIRISNDKIKEFVDEFEFSGFINSEAISDLLNESGYKLKAKVTLTQKIKDFIIENVRKFA